MPLLSHLPRVLLVTAALGTAEAHRGAPSRITASDAPVRCTVEALAEVSPSFDRLLTRIATSRGSVALTWGPCPAPGSAAVAGCMVHHLAETGLGPTVLVFIRRDLDELRLASVLGHELQHAVEVLEAPNVRTDDEIYALFVRIGMRQSLSSNPRILETVAALEAGERVGNEARKHRARLAACRAAQ